MQKPNVNEDYKFLEKHRLMLPKGQKINHISASLQPKVTFVREQGRKEHESNMITVAPSQYCMGGPLYWKLKGHWKSPITGSLLPLYAAPKPIEMPNFKVLSPIQGNPNCKIASFEGFITVAKRNGVNSFEIAEQLEEKLGEALFKHRVINYSIAKMELRDITGNGLLDIVFGTNDWSEYFPTEERNGKIVRTRWSDKDYRPFNSEGKWRGGPLHGEVYYLENISENLTPNTPFEEYENLKFSKPQKIENVDQFGHCTPVFADFTGDGLEDMICADFVRDITFFKRLPNENCETKGKEGNEDLSPHTLVKFKDGTPPRNQDGKPIKLIGVINYLEAIDLTGNGLKDIIIASESGYISILENLGKSTKDGIPMFQDQFYLLQDNAPVKSDILAVPTVAPLREDGENHLDMIVGNGAGFFDMFEDVQTRTPIMQWHLPNIGRTLPNDPEKGSIQGPSENGWGYVCPTLFDWNGNGLYDLLFSDINGEHSISLNSGTKSKYSFKKPVKLMDISPDGGEGMPLITVWRVKPSAIRAENGKVLYYCLDENAKFAVYEKVGDGDSMKVKKRGVIKSSDGKTFTSFRKFGGGRGRIKLQFFQWEKDGRFDLLMSTPANHDFRQNYNKDDLDHYNIATVAVAKNVGSLEEPILEPPRYLKHKSLNEPINFGRHSCAVEAYQWDGATHLLIGAEDGQIYHFTQDEFLY